MILEGIFNALFGILQGLLYLLPDVSWDVNNTVFDVFFDVLHLACYLLPITTIIQIFSIIISITMFRIAVSVVKTIWSLLPFV